MLDAHHEDSVEAWLERAARDCATGPLLQLFEAALAALWAHTETTLGEVTLTAIAERVLFNAAERFPFFAAVTVEPELGIQLRGLRAQLRTLHAAQLREGIRWVLVELLTVIGNLTAELLTPELQAALSHVALPEEGRAVSTEGEVEKS